MGGEVTVDEVLIRLNVDYQKAVAGLNKAKKKFASSEGSLEDVAKSTLIATKAQKKYQVALKKSMGETPFAGYAMSIMFAGMAIKRSFQDMATASMKAFQDLAHSMSDLPTTLDRIKGGFELVKISAGQAINDSLTPLEPLIMGISNKFAELIEKNPELSALFIGLGVGFGNLLEKTGMSILALNGFLDLITKIKAANLGSVISKMASAMLDFSKNVAKIVFTSIVDAIKWINANPLKAGLVGGLITGIILAGLILDNLKDRLGITWGEMFANLGRGFVRIVGIIASTMNAVLGASVGKIMKTVVDAINWIIDQANKVPGVNIQRWSAGGIAYDKRSWYDIFKDVYTNQMGTIEGFANRIFGPQTVSLSPAEAMRQLLLSVQDTASQITGGLFNDGGEYVPLTQQQTGQSTVNNYYNVSPNFYEMFRYASFPSEFQ